MKNRSRNTRLAVRAVAALVAASCLSPLAVVAQEYASRGPGNETTVLDASPLQAEPRIARGREQPAYRLGFIEYEGNDAGEQAVIPGFDWRSPTTDTVEGYDD